MSCLTILGVEMQAVEVDAQRHQHTQANLNSTAIAFNQLWIRMPAVLAAVPTVTQTRCILYQLPPLLDSPPQFYGAGKDSKRQTHWQSRLNAILSGLSASPPPSPFLCQMPFLPQPSQFILAWDRHRIMLSCIPNGLLITETDGANFTVSWKLQLFCVITEYLNPSGVPSQF